MRDNSINFLNENSIPVFQSLPLINSFKIRNAKDVAKRIVVLYGLGALFEGVDVDMVSSWLESEGLFEFTSKEEQSFLSGRKLTEQDINTLSWKQESLYVLCWSGGIINDLNFPSKECNLDDVFPYIPRSVEVGAFLKNFKLRSNDDIRQQLDIYYCLHHSLKHPEMWVNNSHPMGVNITIVEERRESLEWLSDSKNVLGKISLDT